MSATVMNEPVRVQIIGAPIFTCRDGHQDAWRDLARWARRRLSQNFGDAVVVVYHDLLDPDTPPLPAGAQLPVVFVNGDVLDTGGKINMSVIRRRVQEVLNEEEYET